MSDKPADRNAVTIRGEVVAPGLDCGSFNALAAVTDKGLRLAAAGIGPDAVQGLDVTTSYTREAGGVLRFEFRVPLAQLDKASLPNPSDN